MPSDPHPDTLPEAIQEDDKARGDGYINHRGPAPFLEVCFPETWKGKGLRLDYRKDTGKRSRSPYRD